MEKTKVLELGLISGDPIILWGPPGIGKSSMVAAAAAARGWHFEVVPVGGRDETALIGIPYRTKRGVVISPPSWAKRVGQAWEESGQVSLVLLDEVNLARPDLQGALLAILLDKIVGDYKLPAKTRLVAAANPPHQSAGGWELAPPVASRFTHLEMEVSVEGWARDFPSYWGNPPQIGDVEEKTWAPCRAMVAAFVRRRPELFLKVPDTPEAQGKAFPCPRTWDKASRHLAAAGGDVMLAADLIAGAVGNGPGLEFVSWGRELDLPDPEELLRKPEEFKMPSRGDQAYAVLSAVAAAAVPNITVERWLAAWRIFALAAEQGGADVAASAVTTLAKARKPDFPVPVAEIKPFLPLLKTAGLIT